MPSIHPIGSYELDEAPIATGQQACRGANCARWLGPQHVLRFCWKKTLSLPHSASLLEFPKYMRDTAPPLTVGWKIYNANVYIYIYRP